MFVKIQSKMIDNKELTTLFIADDHPAITESIKLTFSKHFNEVFLFHCGQSLKDRLLNVDSATLILDMNLPIVSGLEILEFIQTNSLDIDTIVYSMYESSSLISKCYSLGAKSYLLKSESVDTLLDLTLNLDVNNVNKVEAIQDLSVILTEREQEVIVLISKDLNTREISDLLNVSEHTVSTHRRNIKKKLNVNTTAGIVGFGYQNGLIQI